MGIRDRPTSPRSPWQNAYAERLIGSIVRSDGNYVVVLGERHLRHILLSYNEVRTHLSLNKDAPAPRPIQSAGLHSLPSDLERIPPPLSPPFIYANHPLPMPAPSPYSPPTPIT